MKSYAVKKGYGNSISYSIFLYFATRSKDNLCSTEWARCCYEIVKNLLMPFLRDKGYNVAAQVERCFIIQIFYLFYPWL